MRIFSHYLAYLKDNPERYWFKRKLYGWGWTPARWPGWVVTGAYIGLLVVTLNEYARVSDVLALALFLIASVIFITVAWCTGESPRWQWGNDTTTGNK
jgi:hypothetical protein